MRRSSSYGSGVWSKGRSSVTARQDNHGSGHYPPRRTERKEFRVDFQMPNAYGFSGTITSTADPMLGPLGNYGGPTPTLALLAGSPALDTGSNALIPAGVTTDQRGFPRISNGTVDVGAFESQAPITLSQTLAAGTYGSPYSQTLTATGGAGSPYTFLVTSGTLPGGLMLAPSGALTGTPTE